MESDAERLRRWRLVLGGGNGDGIGVGLTGTDGSVDACLAALYQAGEPDRDAARGAGLEASAPSVARWLGDIRAYFPKSVVQVMQKDAIERLDLTSLLLEPEMLASVEPDVHLVGSLIALNRAMPEKTRETARTVVRKVVEEIERRLAQRTSQAVKGALNRAARSSRPRPSEIDWHRTIRANLRHYQPEYRTVIPERLVGFGHKQQAVQRDIILCVDQSGSMASSVVFSSVFAAVMASLRSLRTSLVVFDTSVVDMTEKLADPVEILFGTQLGGGTDINRALGYCQNLIRTPKDTILVLLSDLFEGGLRDEMLRRAASMIGSGVTVVALLALSDDGAPAFHRENAATLSALGAPAFACTPDLFPELMAAAIERGDIEQWAAGQGVTVVKGTSEGAPWR